MSSAALFNDAYRRRKSDAFELAHNSTARRTIDTQLWGKPVAIYANANLSIYSAQACNARCPFCVEELRPASRGSLLAAQKSVEPDDERYFARLDETLRTLAPLLPTVSITGGEASKDPRLVRILQTLAQHDSRKRTLTTNGSGLLDVRDGRTIIEWIVATQLLHLNISRAHPDDSRNAALMAYSEGLPLDATRAMLATAKTGGVRPRLSCVLLRRGVADLAGIIEYLAFAQTVGVDNVIFRQLMKSDPSTHETGPVVRFSDRERVPLEPILDALAVHPDFTFVRQIIGYYYYVEVWRWRDLIDVVFEEADLATLERTKHRDTTIHELVFHPNANLASTWQPWDGVLGPA